MSDSESDPDESSARPKSMRQQRILDIAADRPDASFDAIAADVPTADADLVERVIDRYGDPANDSPAPEHTMDPDSEPPVESLTDKQIATLQAIADDPDATQREIGNRLDVSAATISNRVNEIDGFEWSDRESMVRQILAAIEEDDASDLGEKGGDGSSGDDEQDDGSSYDGEAADSPTESGNDSSGRSTGDRSSDYSEPVTPVAVADEVGPSTASEADGQTTNSPGDEPTTEPTEDRSPTTPTPATTDEVRHVTDGAGGTLHQQEGDDKRQMGDDKRLEVDDEGREDAVVQELRDRLSAIEQQVSESKDRSVPFDDPELAHKVVHACMESDTISEDEELRIIESIIRRN